MTTILSIAIELKNRIYELIKSSAKCVTITNLDDVKTTEIYYTDDMETMAIVIKEHGEIVAIEFE